MHSTIKETMLAAAAMLDSFDPGVIGDGSTRNMIARLHAEARLLDNAEPARHVENPRPRLFEFCTGDEIDVDRYVSLNMQGSTAFLQTRHSYIRVEFESVEQMRSEIERMRRFRDEGTARGVERRIAAMSDDEIRQTLVDIRQSTKTVLVLDGREADPDRIFSSLRQHIERVQIFEVGDRVRTKDGQVGTVARIHNAPHNYVIELDDPDPSGGVIMHWPVGADGLQAL